MSCVRIKTDNQQGIHKRILMIGNKNYRSLRNILLTLNMNSVEIKMKADFNVEAKKGIP